MENGTEIFKNKKSEGDYMTLVTFKITRTAKTAKTPYNNFLSGEVFLSWLKVLFAVVALGACGGLSAPKLNRKTTLQ